MQIFELTQKRTVKEYDPNRPPPKKNFGAGVGPGVQPQYTATPRVKAAPQPGAAPQLPPPAAGQQPPTMTAPPQLSAPAAVPQIGTTYDPNVIDVDARVKPEPATAPALAAPAEPAQPAATTVRPTARQGQQAVQSYQQSAEIPPEPIDTIAPAPPPSAANAVNPVPPAPSTPGVRGSQGWFSRPAIGALGQRLNAYNASRAGLEVPDTGDNQPYGDQRAAAARASATSISQQAREELAKWNQAIATAVDKAGIQVDPAVRKKNPTAGIGQLPVASRKALEVSLMNQVLSNFLQGRLGKDYRQLPKWLEPESQQDALAQISKLDNAIKAILNFNAPPSDQATQLQRWQDLAQSTYDMRSLLQFHGRKAEQNMPDITNTPDGSYFIGNHKLNTADPAESRIANIIKGQIQNGRLPDIFANPLGTYQIGDYEFETETPAKQRLEQLIKSQLPRAKQSVTPSPAGATAQSDLAQALANLGYSPQQVASLQKKVPPGTSTNDAIRQILQGTISESLTWSRGFDPSRTLLEKIKKS